MQNGYSYLVETIGFDAAENGPSKGWPIIVFQPTLDPLVQKTSMVKSSQKPALLSSANTAASCVAVAAQ